MATPTSKARDRAIARTLEAALQMVERDESAPANGSAHPVRCPECGAINREKCCWYSRHREAHGADGDDSPRKETQP
ncbi:MAG: hypothetical protein V4671_27885 [Armatimonadota bacterium]